MRQKDLFPQILKLVCSGKLKEPFKASQIPFLSSSPTFLGKHAIGNPGKYTPYFKRHVRGQYLINPIYKKCP